MVGKVQPFGHTLRELTTYDLVSRGDVAGKECRGSYDSATYKGWGRGYKYSCMHSGSIKVSGDLPTTWYNYVLATAGTISEETDSTHPAANTTTATESICPKGWALPDEAQILGIGPRGGSAVYVSNFSPVLGGNYYNAALNNETVRGFWWGSEAFDGARRGSLGYNGSTLYFSANYRHGGNYIRCVQKST